ncbi:putative ribonuclease H-like domain-containing protein [Tanacetum coccineum]
MSAKDTIVVQRCDFSAKELNEFLSFYPISSEYDVILPKSTKTIFDAPPGYVGLYTHSFSLTSLRLPLTGLFYEPAEVTTDSGESPKAGVFVMHPGSVDARIKERKCKTSGCSSSHSCKEEIGLPESSSSHVVCAKNSTSKDDDPILSISDDDDGLPNCFELKYANACYLKISAITSPAWKGYLDNQIDLELLDLHDRCYARQVVVDNVVNRRAHEFLHVIKKMRGESDVIKARERSRKELRVKCEASIAKFDQNPDVLVLREKISSLTADIKEHKGDSLEAEKARLEAVEASLRREVEELKKNRRDVVSKVASYAALDFVHSDELARLVGTLVSSSITYGRCRAYEQVATMKEPFNLSKAKGYRSSYKKEHTQASNDFSTTTFPWLDDFIADVTAPIEALLSKKPPALQKPTPSRTQMPVPSSQKATPSFASSSNTMSPPANLVKPSSPTNKKDKRGNVIRNKARLVAQGYTQEEGIDYDEVFVLVARIKAIRLFLAYASFKDFVVYQMDVKSAFLYGKIEEEVYVYQPPGFEDPEFPDKVYKRGHIDKTLFIKRIKSDILLVQVYVDDIIFRSTKKELCNDFEKLMHKKFQMSSMGELTFFLRLQVTQKHDRIFISQDNYVEEILNKFGFSTVKTASTPMETLKPLLKDAEAEDVDVYLYRSMIRSLMYLIASRPDIIYLKGQSKLGLWYPKDSPFNLEAYTDNDYDGASLDRKSTTGGCQFLGKRLISWQCKKQTIVANSTTEAEYIAATSCYGQVRWIQNQMLDYGYNFMNTKIFIDSESTICIFKNPMFHSKTKHIENRHHFIRDSNVRKLIQMIKIHTNHNVANLLTKAFDVERFQYLIATIGMLNL